MGCARLAQGARIRPLRVNSPAPERAGGDPVRTPSLLPRDLSVLIMNKLCRKHPVSREQLACRGYRQRSSQGSYPFGSRIASLASDRESVLALSESDSSHEFGEQKAPFRTEVDGSTNRACQLETSLVNPTEAELGTFVRMASVVVGEVTMDWRAALMLGMSRVVTREERTRLSWE